MGKKRELEHCNPEGSNIAALMSDEFKIEH